MNTLRGRLIATFLVIALSAVAIVGLFAVSRSRTAIIDGAWKEGQALASDLSIKVDAYLQERARVVEMQAESHAVRSMDWAQQEPALTLLFDHYDFLDIFVANLDGTVRSLKLDARGVNIKDRDYFIQAVREKRSVVSDPIVNRATGSLNFAYAFPIISNGNVVGVLVALEALERASSEADTYLAARYQLPLSSVPKALAAVVCDMARYRLTGGETTETTPIATRYRAAVAWLKDVAAGRAVLPGVAATPAGGGVEFSPGRRDFARNLATDEEA